MVHFLSRLVVGALTLWVLASQAGGVPVEGITSPRPAGWVTDQTGRVSVDTRAAIDAVGDRVKAQGRGELAVVVVRSVDGADPRDFATRLFNRWAIGEAGRDNGILIFVALDDRAAEIILGDGLDNSQNVREAERIMRDALVPHLRQGDVSGAVREGARLCAERVLQLSAAVGSPAGGPARAITPARETPAAVEDLPPVEAEGFCEGGGVGCGSDASSPACRDAAAD